MGTRNNIVRVTVTHPNQKIADAVGELIQLLLYEQDLPQSIDGEHAVTYRGTQDVERRINVLRTEKIDGLDPFILVIRNQPPTVDPISGPQGEAP